MGWSPLSEPDIKYKCMDVSAAFQGTMDADVEWDKAATVQAQSGDEWEWKCEAEPTTQKTTEGLHSLSRLGCDTMGADTKKKCVCDGMRRTSAVGIWSRNGRRDFNSAILWFINCELIN